MSEEKQAGRRKSPSLFLFRKRLAPFGGKRHRAKLAGAQRYGFQAALPKPFTLEQLSEALARVIRGDVQ